jgi:AraC-like DNA-binding protein
LRDVYQPMDLPALHERVCRAMREDRQRAAEAFTDWLAETLPAPTPEALLANAMVELIDTDPAILTVEDAAAHLHVSARTLQRLARRYVGLPPLAMIRRRRLQEAAERLRTDPNAHLAALAVELGYTDHAHLANEFKSVLGFTPSAYRHSTARFHAPQALECMYE